ncbi:MAG: ABC transporter permease [Promethearchaeota archaeon]
MLDRPIRTAFSLRKEQFKLSIGVARRNITRSKYRSFLLIFGVLLTVALETGISISVDTLYDDFVLDNRNQNFTDITINPIAWVGLSGMETLTKDVRKIPGVGKASPVYFFTVNRFLGEEFRTNILVYGVDSQNHPDMPHFELKEGSRSLSGNKIIISRRIQYTLGLKIGDVIDLSAAGSSLNVVNVEVSGIISDTSAFGNKLGFLYIIADIKTVLSAIPRKNQSELLINGIDMSVTDLLQVREVAEKIEDTLGLEYAVSVEKEISQVQAAGIRAYQTAMNLVILTSFIVEFLFMTNLLAIAIRDRQKEIGILRAVGAKSWQLVEQIGIEILVYAFIGSFFGIFLGIGFSIVLVEILDQFYTSIELSIILVHPSTFMAIFLSGIVVALISGLYPIFLATSMPVVQNIHSRMRQTKSPVTITKSMWKYTAGAGIILTVTAFVLQLFIGPSRFLDFSLLSMHFISVIMIFLGTILIEIGFLIFLPRIAWKMLFWYSPVTRTISIRNVAREFQKSLFTIMTAAMALTFIIIVGSLSTSIIAEVPSYFQDQWGTIDVVAEMPDNNLRPMNSTIFLDNRHTVQRSAFIQETRTEINTINGYVFGVDAKQYSHFSERVLQSVINQPSYHLLNLSQRSSSRNITYGLVTDLLFQRLRVPLGTNVSIKVTDNSTVNITLLAVVKANIFLRSGEYLYINSSCYQEFFNSTLAKWFICQKTKEAISAKGSMEIAFPDAIDITEITTFTEIMERTLSFQAAIFQALFIQSFILAGIAQFVCILVTTLRMEREMGIMRSFGLSKGGVFSIFMAESTILGFTALIVGLIDGFVGIALLLWYISLSIPINLIIPPLNIFFWIIASIFITLASTVVPAYRSSQKNIVATISGHPKAKGYGEKPSTRQRQWTWTFLPEPSLLTTEPIPTSVEVDTSVTSMNTLQLGISFLRAKKNKIQIIFLGGLSLAAMNYIFDSRMSINGLILSELLIRFFISFSYFGYDFGTPLLNPLLFIVGLVMMTPISSYLSKNHQGRNLLIRTLGSFLIGIISITIIILSWIIINIAFYIFLWMLIMPLAMSIYGEPIYYIADSSTLFFTQFIFIFVIEILFFQRIWALLLYRGFSDGKSLRSHIAWIRQNGSRGQVGFLSLVLLHQIMKGILNNLLYFLFRPPIRMDYSEYFDYYEYLEAVNYLPPLHPISFIILMSFEIGFLLVLVVYQLMQFYKEEGKTL